MQQPTRDPSPTPTANEAPLGFGEFVSLAAALMGLTALGIDSMMPALPAIAETLGVVAANDRQYIFTAFLIGFAISQLFYGPLADRFGRRPVLGAALAAYVVFNVLAAFAGSFTLMLIVRFLGGAAAGGARVVTVALVRDCFAGRAMARVMSLVFMVFMAAPILAPSFGQLILLFAEWRWIFGGIAAVALVIAIWFGARMPETLAPERRQRFELAVLLGATRKVVTDRTAVGYTLASAALTGGLFGFVGSIQQIMTDVFHRGDLLAVVFACVAGTMAVGSLLNSRIVMHLGTRRISHTALSLFVAIAAVHLALAWSGHEDLWTFAILQALMMACFGLSTGNFSAMAMEHMGEIAGTASSIQGFVTTLSGALIGAVIGQAFDGTTVPLYAGFVAMGALAWVLVFIAERGRMFRPT